MLKSSKIPTLAEIYSTMPEKYQEATGKKVI
jgi:hypothetical protein